jgi:protein-arginine deiminase
MRSLLNLSRLLMQCAPSTTSKSDIRQSYQDVLIVGQEAQISIRSLAPPEATSVRMDVDEEIEVKPLASDKSFSLGTLVSLEKAPISVALIGQKASKVLDDRSVEITFLNQNDEEIVTYQLLLTVLHICLDVDADRDGVVEENNPHKAQWQWGEHGYGAILLVHSDWGKGPIHRELEDEKIQGPLKLEDLSQAIVRPVGPKILPPGCFLRLLVSEETANRIRIFDRNALGRRQLIGPGFAQATLPDVSQEIALSVEGLEYPDANFDGLVKLDLSLVRHDEPLYRDRVIFRVAPWIMTPKTLAPTQVYVSRLKDGKNAQFIRHLKTIVEQAGAELVEIPPHLNRDDQWMQDEIEIGYSQAPGIKIPVVFDSPRNRGLAPLGEEWLLGQDFGYVSRSKGEPNSLDSFGNLEVSPPVTVDGINYPFGRMIFGGARPTAAAGRRVMSVVQDLLYAQKVQAPIKIYSDWLFVGHIDEFMTFVPAPTSKEFKLLLASPEQCYCLLKELETVGRGNAILMKGKQLDGKPADITVSELLKNKILAGHNYRYQEYIDWNRAVLKKELGLDEKDIIHLPALFQPKTYSGRAETYFPNIINMIVLDKHLGIPKPYGPKVEGHCQFEAYTERVLGQLGLICHFIDDWEPYFRKFGDIHCGTNTRRQPFTKKWWAIKPPESFDIF